MRHSMLLLLMLAFPVAGLKADRFDQWDKTMEASPLSWVHEKAAPFFIAHGTADETVPFNQSAVMAGWIHRK